MTSRETVEDVLARKYSADDLNVILQDWDHTDPDQAIVINLAAEVLQLRALAGRAEAVAEVVQSEQTGGHALHFPAGYAETLDSLPIGTKLYTHPPASVPEVTEDATDTEIEAWAIRHGFDGWSATDRRAAFEDAQTWSRRTAALQEQRHG